MILHYLLSAVSNETLEELAGNFPKYKHEGTEVELSHQIKEISGTDQMTFQLFIDGNSLSLARYMDKINNMIFQVLVVPPTILINESSARFNLELYPLVNKFERKLRTMIYLKNAGNNDPSVVNQLETLTFEKIYELLFTDINFMNSLRELVKKGRTSSRLYYIREIQKIEEHTKWDSIVGSAHLDIIKEQFLDIIDFRNDVMHAHNITYERYYEAKKLFTYAILALEKEINLLLESAEYREKSQEEILTLVQNLTNDIPEEYLDALQLLTEMHSSEHPNSSCNE